MVKVENNKEKKQNSDRSYLTIEENGFITVWSDDPVLIKKLLKIGSSKIKIKKIIGKNIYCG